MPILGTIASQVPANLPTSSFESISTTFVSSGTSSSITFSSIPSSYKHLQVRGLIRSTYNDVVDMPKVVINSDSTAANYRGHGIQGTGSSLPSGDLSGDPYLRFGRLPAGMSSSGIFGGFVFDLLDYQNTNKHKVIRSIGGHDSNDTNGFATYFSGVWLSTSAVSSLTFSCSGNFAQYSRIALYGIKG